MSYHHRRTKPVELGDEPPLTVGDTDPARYSRRGVSLRWLFGAVVTAVTSVALMGGALVAALDGRYVMAANATPFAGVPSPAVPKAQKGDRVMPAFEPVSSRKVIEVPTVVRQGDDNLIQNRPYALVNASLVLDSGAIGDVPPFNPRELQEKSAPVATTDAIYDKAVDGEITVSVSEFPLDAPVTFDEGLELPEAEVERQIRGAGPEDGEVLAVGTEAEAEAVVDPGSITPPNVSVVPENVSELIKSTDEALADNSANELVEVVQPGDTLSKILLGSGVGSADVKEIVAVLERLGVATVRPGQTIRAAFALDEEAEDATRRPSRLSVYDDGAHVASVALTDEGRFVLGEAPPGPPPVVAEEPVAVANEDRLPSIYKSLYQTAVDHGLPERVREQLLATFSLDVDFNTRVRPGDTLTVLHSASEDGSEPEILYAGLTAGGVARAFYRFKSGDGTVDYFDGEGRTGDKFLLRKPMERGVFRSGFGMRRHPILRRTRMHNGVDYAAPRGTPIYAAGDGVVTQAGWKAGYGRWVAIRHANGYETGYAHQSRIANSIKPGVRVQQGQVIGYVGSTGFSTGPHLHYEVMVNGRHVNPLKIRLRRGRELSGEALAVFQQERDRIDALVQPRPMPVASN